MDISATMVKDLRSATGAGVLDCRKALETANGNFDRAAALLREKGLASAAKKATRQANEGLIGHYVHTGSKVAALVEINCESDFVAMTPEFQALTRDLAMQVVAARPNWVRPEDVPADVIAKEKEVYLLQVGETDQPQEEVERIITGKLAKYYEENCLLEQPFIKNNSKSIKDVINETIAKLGENIVVRRFVRMEVGG